MKISVNFGFLIACTSFFAVIVSADDNGETPIIKKLVVHRRPDGENQRPGENGGGDRRQKRVISQDKIEIETAFNSQRSLVGSSDMNYLSWDYLTELDVTTWVYGCDFEATYYATLIDTYVISLIFKSSFYHTSAISGLFNNSQFYYPLRSINLDGVSGSYRRCSILLSQDKTYYNAYLVAYGFPSTKLFNENVKQFKNGLACTECQSGSYWCYSNLCREDCSTSFTSGCSCQPNCNTGTVESSRCSCRCSQGRSGNHCEVKMSPNASSDANRISVSTTVWILVAIFLNFLQN